MSSNPKGKYEKEDVRQSALKKKKSYRGKVSGDSDGKDSVCNAGDLSSIPRARRCPGEGNDNLLQYSCLENSMDRGVRWATVHGVAKSWTRLSDKYTYTHTTGKKNHNCKWVEGNCDSYP